MKRKLFSAILFGALLTASTSGLTSCKDYDDDISNLQGQIDKLAAADQLFAKVSDMQAAISAAQSAAEAKAAAAQTVADAAKAAAADAAAAASKAQSTADAAAAAAAEVQKAADKAIAELEAKAATKDELKAAADAAEAAVKAIQDAHAADKAAIEKAIADGLAEVKAEIAKTNEELAALAKRLDAVEEKLAAIEAGEGQEEALKEIQEEVEAIAEVLEDIIGEYTSMVTEVSLYKSVALDKSDPFALDFVYVAQEKTTTFPAEEGVADAQIEFSEKNKNVTTKDSLTIRVSPTNAILNPANISLINSQGKELSDYVEIESVKPCTELLTKSAEGNGLWNVVFKVKEGVDREKFADAVVVGPKKVLFAVAVNNTESNDVRRVISSYDVTAAPSTYEPARTDFQVTNSDGVWKNVAEIHNRYYYNGTEDFGATSQNKEHATASEGTVVKDIPEYAWENEPQIEGSKTGRVNSGNTDKRNGKELLEVAVGQEIKLSVGTQLVGNEPSYVNEENKTAYSIKGFYVTLDKNFAIESSPSEWNAWKKYDYTNVGIPGTSTTAKLFYGNTGAISIDDEDAKGDIIGFRVYAVNLDGTLVDPDGRAFYVRVGEEKTSAPLTIDDLEAVLNYDKDHNVLHFNGNNYYSESVALSDEVLAVIASVDNTKTVWSITSNPSVYGNNSRVPAYTTAGVNTNSYEIEYIDKNGDEVTEMKDAVKARVKIKDPLKFLDDAEYTAKATLKNKVGTALCDVTVKFTKVLPTEAPALTWTSGYDPTKQVFANAEAASAKIYKIGNTNPYAVEMKTLLNTLNYGAGTAGTAVSYYTLTFKGVLDANKKANEITIGNKGTENATDYSAYVFEAGDKNAVDGASHDIVYNYNYGKISLTKNYQTGNFTEGFCNPEGAAALKMTFNTWSMFEQYALRNPLTLTYLQQGNNDTAGTLYLGYTKPDGGSSKNVTTFKESSDVVAVSSTAASGYTKYYKEAFNKFYAFNPVTGLFKKQNGDDFRATTEVTEKVLEEWGDPVDTEQEGHHTAGKYVRVQWSNGLTGNAAKSYTLLVKAAGDASYNTTSSGSENVTAKTTYKKLGDKYYKAKLVEETGEDTYKFVDENDNVLNVQTAAYVDENGVEMPNGILDKTKPVYVQCVKKVTTGNVAEKLSDVAAWNTVVFNWSGTGSDAIARFGTASAKADLGKLIYDGYLKVTSVKTADSDPFYVVETAPTANGSYTLKQRVGTLTPGTSGTIYVKVIDCFEKETTITLTYSIR